MKPTYFIVQTTHPPTRTRTHTHARAREHARMHTHHSSSQPTAVSEYTCFQIQHDKQVAIDVNQLLWNSKVKYISEMQFLLTEFAYVIKTNY